jgi:hypothetical protein
VTCLLQSPAYIASCLINVDLHNAHCPIQIPYGERSVNLASSWHADVVNADIGPCPCALTHPPWGSKHLCCSGIHLPLPIFSLRSVTCAALPRACSAALSSPQLLSVCPCQFPPVLIFDNQLARPFPIGCKEAGWRLRWAPHLGLTPARPLPGGAGGGGGGLTDQFMKRGFCVPKMRPKAGDLCFLNKDGILSRVTD